jgi:hypothetical protein
MRGERNKFAGGLALSVHSKSPNPGSSSVWNSAFFCCAGWAMFAGAGETVFRAVFGQEGKAFSLKSRTFPGSAAAEGAIENSAAWWNASVARAERLTEDGRAFLRIHVEKIDSSSPVLDRRGGEIALKECSYWSYRRGRIRRRFSSAAPVGCAIPRFGGGGLHLPP